MEVESTQKSEVSSESGETMVDSNEKVKYEEGVVEEKDFSLDGKSETPPLPAIQIPLSPKGPSGQPKLYLPSFKSTIMKEQSTKRQSSLYLRDRIKGKLGLNSPGWQKQASWKELKENLLNLRSRLIVYHLPLFTNRKSLKQQEKLNI